MGIFGALTTAVAGLRAQSYALENISGNIANSQTTGFKRVDTSFVDFIPELPRNQAKSGSVGSFARYTNTIQGDLQSTSIPTNVALNGEGYFVVGEQATAGTANTIADNRDLYTRRGDFTLDREGRLVNGAGYYLKGWDVDPQTGAVSTTAPAQVLRMPETVAATPTTTVLYTADLPRDAAVPDVAAPAATITQAGNAAFLAASLPGGSTVAYDDQGNAAQVELRWVPTTTADTWNLYYSSNTDGVTDPAWTRFTPDFTFAANGTLTAPAAPSTVTVTGLTVDGLNVGDVTFDFGENRLRQRALTSGQASITNIEQNGRPEGTLDTVAVSNDGLISGKFSNGTVLPVALVGIAQFAGDNFLKRSDGGIFEETLESGRPQSAYASTVATGNTYPELRGSSVIEGHIEGSNTDIADEFAKMIVTQQAYSANTRVVSTSQDLLRETINMIR